MKKLITSILIAMCLSGVSTVYAGNWWEKIVDTVQSFDKDQSSTSSVVGELSNTDISKAFKQALQIGSENVVKQLGRKDGFNADSLIHIPLPDDLKRIRKILKKVGLERYADDLELKLNRAAEAATPKAKKLFLDAIKQMTFKDVQTIYNGPKDSATRYFQKKMSPQLAGEMRPVVNKAMSEVGVVQAYDGLIKEYKDIPFVPDVKADLTKHVVNKGMEGIFYYLAKEEAEIRKDPVRHTTDLLRKVFGNK
ncbi:MAG: DUF4197 domain-containing protein [Gammaproteobacteria bacterium]|nr:MAG: DUF4197 domain-containing protein [Gammaproteobacteria bacterium]